MIGMTAALWLVAATIAAAPPAASPARPINLVTQASGDGMRLRLVGASAVACDASYALEVWNGSTPTASRSVQRGTARLRPGVEARLVTMDLAGVDPARWSVRLRVVPCGPAASYEETRGQFRVPE